jgi:hypothetical protein
VYDVYLGEIETSKAAWPTYSKRLEAVLLSRASKKDVTIVSSRTAVVWTQSAQHQRIKRVWPEIACIGQSGGDESIRKRNGCVKYLRAVLKLDGVSSALPVGVNEPVCQTFLDKL